MKKIGDIYRIDDLKIELIYWINTPQVSIELGIVREDNDKNLKGDDQGEYNRFHTTIIPQHTNIVDYETHVDVDHLINNLLCRNISLTLIETLLERELKLESFTHDSGDRHVLKYLKKSERDIDHHDIMYSFWVASRHGVNPCENIKKRYKK